MCSLLGLCRFSISTVALSSLQQALSSGVNYRALVDMAARSMSPLPPPRLHLILPPWREWSSTSTSMKDRGCTRHEILFRFRRRRAVKFLTTEEAKSWCQARTLKVTADRYLHYEPDNPHCFTLGLEEKPSRVIALADYLVPTWEDVPFQGALLWIRERGVWGDYSEKTGEMIVQQMRLAKGESEPSGSRRACIRRLRAASTCMLIFWSRSARQKRPPQCANRGIDRGVDRGCRIPQPQVGVVEIRP